MIPVGAELIPLGSLIWIAGLDKEPSTARAAIEGRGQCFSPTIRSLTMFSEKDNFQTIVKSIASASVALENLF